MSELKLLFPVGPLAQPVKLQSNVAAINNATVRFILLPTQLIIDISTRPFNEMELSYLPTYTYSDLSGRLTALINSLYYAFPLFLTTFPLKFPSAQPRQYPLHA